MLFSAKAKKEKEAVASKETPPKETKAEKAAKRDRTGSLASTSSDPTTAAMRAEIVAAAAAEESSEGGGMSSEVLRILDNCERLLTTPGLGAVDSYSMMDSKLRQLKTFEENLGSYRKAMNKIRQSSATDILPENVILLKTRWEHCCAQLKRAREYLESTLHDLGTFEANTMAVDEWLNNAHDFLTRKTSEEPKAESFNSVKGKLETIQALLSDASVLDPQMSQLSELAKKLAIKAAPDFASRLSARAKELRDSWSEVNARLNRQESSCKHFLDKNKRGICDEAQELSDWLISVQAELSSCPSPQSVKELQAQIKKHKHLKENFLAKSGTINAARFVLREEGDVEQFDVGETGTSVEVDEVGKSELRSLVNQYEVVSSFIDERSRFLSSGFDMWKEFEELLAAEKACLDLLEKKLNEPLKVAADAEEFSEQLDLLERLMEGSGHHDKIVELGDTLLARNIIAEVVSTELNRYNERRQKLLEPAKERQYFLETGVMEAQEFEELLLKCQSWIGHVDFILSSRLDSDILAADIPEEYKLALTNGTLASQLDQEFHEHSACIDRLLKQVAVYREDGREQAAKRLSEQIAHVQQQMAEVRQKFARFQHPGDFEQRLKRIWRILNDANQSIELLKVRCEDNAILVEQIDKAQRLAEALAEVKPEFDYVLDSGQKIIDLEQTDNPTELKQRLDTVFSQYNFICNQLLDCQVQLEEAQKVSEKMNAEIKESLRFIQGIESELSAWETESPSKLMEEITYIQEAQQNLIRREADLALIDDLLSQWVRLAQPEGRDSAEARVQYLRSRWHELADRLLKWIESLQTMESEKSETWMNFEVAAFDMKKWLDLADATLKDIKISHGSPDRQRQLIVKLQREITDVKPKLTELRDCAVDLKAKGDKDTPAADIEQDLIFINARWESILEQVKSLQKQISLDSSTPTAAAAGVSSPSLPRQDQQQVTSAELLPEPKPSPPTFRILATKRIESFEGVVLPGEPESIVAPTIATNGHRIDAASQMEVSAISGASSETLGQSLTSSTLTAETVEFMGGSSLLKPPVRRENTFDDGATGDLSGALAAFREDLQTIGEMMASIEQKLMTACELRSAGVGEDDQDFGSALDQQEEILKLTRSELTTVHNALMQMENPKNRLLAEVESEDDRREIQGFDRLVDSCMGYARIIDTLYKDLLRRTQLAQDLDEESSAEDLLEENSSDDLDFLLDETDALIRVNPDPTDNILLQEYRLSCQARQSELAEKLGMMLRIKRQAQQQQEAGGGEPATSAERFVRQKLEDIEHRIRSLSMQLSDKLKPLDAKITRCIQFWRLLKELRDWIKKAKKLLEDFQKAFVYEPTQVDPNAIRNKINEKQADLETLKEVLNAMYEESCGADIKISDKAEVQLKEVMQQWCELLQLSGNLVSRSSSSTEESLFATSPTAVSLAASGLSSPAAKRKQVTLLVDEAPEEDFRIQPKLLTPSSPRQAAAASPGSSAAEAAKPSPYQPPQTPADRKTASQIAQIVELRHWLTDSQRECFFSVDVTDMSAIKDAARKHLTFADQLQAKRLQIIRVLEATPEADVQVKAEILCRDWERCYKNVQRRKKELSEMTEASVGWDNLRVELELWMSECERKITGGKKVSEMGLAELAAQLQLVERMVPEFDEYKTKMQTLNAHSNKLIDHFSSDDSTAVSEIISELNTRWSRLNDNFRVHKAVVEAQSRARRDHATALSEFTAWLAKVETQVYKLDVETSNVQAIKDSDKRATLIEQTQNLKAEIDAHADIVQSLERVGQGSPQEILDKLQNVAARWQELKERAEVIRVRLEQLQEQWERLQRELRENIFWVETKQQELAEQQPVGGDFESVKQQKQFVRNVLNEVSTRSPAVDELLQLASSFLIQQDLRPKMRGSIDYSADDHAVQSQLTARRVAQQIKSERETLSDKFRSLKETAKKWEAIIDAAHDKMIQFNEASVECEGRLKESEGLRSSWTPVADILLEELPDQMEQAKIFQRNLETVAKRVMDDVNDHSSRLLAENVHLSSLALDRVESLNNRFKALQTAINARVQSLTLALRDFGPSSQHFLAGSVAEPWQRAISDNRVPYFINHETEQTSWDHPKMIEIMEQLCEFNDVKFSAYRTAIKLRALQKKLCLDLITLNDLIAVFEKQRLRAANDKLMDISEMVLTLLPIYELLQSHHPVLIISVPILIDLCLNWLLNLFDTPRVGNIRVLSFKVSLVLLCNAPIEDKYKYIFKQVSANGSTVEQRKLALLLHDCLQVPKFLGEVAAFGGTNIEPSVRSCFEKAQFPPEVNLSQFLEWLKCEPQSMIWLPVLHRVAAAECVKHQAKCNVCKMFPLIGLRYRCLSCFNFDMCQNCFFSQRKAKGHKLTHPMQEYCTAATSTEDVKDFGKVIANKFKPKTYWKKHPRLGFLPVQSVVEGSPIGGNSGPPENPLTQDLHGRVETFTTRLAEIERSQHLMSVSGTDESGTDDEHQMIASYCASLGPDSSLVSPVQSPFQIVSQVDDMGKEEMESHLRKLENENKLLQAEYERLRSSRATTASTLGGGVTSSSVSHLPITNGSVRRPTTLFPATPTSPITTHVNVSHVTSPLSPLSLPRSQADGDVSEEELLVEAKVLRQHKARLEARMQVLEDHNRQLEAQLTRLKQLIDDKSTSDIRSGQTTPLTSSSLRYRSLPRNGYAQGTPEKVWQNGDAESAAERSSSRINDLLSMAEDVGRAMGSLVNVVTSDDEASTEDEESDSDDTIEDENNNR